MHARLCRAHASLASETRAVRIQFIHCQRVHESSNHALIRMCVLFSFKIEYAFNANRGMLRRFASIAIQTDATRCKQRRHTHISDF